MKIRKTVETRDDKIVTYLPMEGEFVDWVNTFLEYALSGGSYSGKIDACDDYVLCVRKNGLSIIYEPVEESIK